MVTQLIAYGILVAVAIVLLIDAVPVASEWLSRIHIGRYRDDRDWSRSVARIGAKWLNRTPKIKVTDNTRFVALDMLRGNYTKSAIQHWQEASLLIGLAEYARSGGSGTGTGLDDVIRKEIDKYLRSHFDGEGRWLRRPEQVDGAILAYAVMKHAGNPDRYKPAYDEMWETIAEMIGEDGTIRYRRSMGGYRYVDTIGFVCPFLVAYGVRYGNRECVDLALRQLREYGKYGMLDKAFIPSHAYHVETKLPIGLYGWGRGLGWFAIGLADAWRELPADDPGKTELAEMMVRFARSAASFQREDGSWSWTITRRESRPDSSATAVLGWFLQQAAAVDPEPERCRAASRQALCYLMKVTRRSGAVDFSQGDTKDLGVYSMLFSLLPFTQGFCMRMAHSAGGEIRS